MSANESAVLETISTLSKKGRQTVIHAYEFGEGTCNDKHKPKVQFLKAFYPSRKKGNDDVTSLEFGEGTSANESAVLETISPQQKEKDDGNTH